jgi:hypothetical protein
VETCFGGGEIRPISSVAILLVKVAGFWMASQFGNGAVPM